jgi:phosphoribosylaminoimidazole-succinocarboxamide synthase
MLYEGKAKRVFATDDEGVLLHRYKDDATAFNAKKRGSWEGKGKTNATMSAALFEYLETQGVPTHFVEQSRRRVHNDEEAGDAAGRGSSSGTSPPARSRGSGFRGGRKLKAPIVELCYKDDDLDDPMLNWYHFRELGVADEDLAFCEELGLRVNEILVPFFDEKASSSWTSR